MEFPKTKDVEDTLQLNNIKGLRGKRERAKKSLAHLKTVFQTFSWPDDSTAIRAIEHTAEKFRTLKSKKVLKFSPCERHPCSVLRVLLLLLLLP